jgi:alanyl-tRNA synthetase
MRSAEIRQWFLDFFREKRHTIVPSSSLLPDTPNLLFTNAGMNQFVPIFLGQKSCPYKPGRAANTQKCIRAGGKHNDLEDVGFDTYHHTFFEMLGNWSFGDYFKPEAIDWAWELLVKRWKFPPWRLYATYFGGDEKTPADTEAKELWLRYLPADHVLPGSRKDNFWMMGDTGPCGPCSEIHMDLTPAGDSAGKLVNAGSPLCMEIWNLVFIQFNANPDGSLSSLPARHVDTGMGFERVAGIIQCTGGLKDFSGNISNYDSDIFAPIFRRLEELSGKKYAGRLQIPTDIAFRVIADHLRCLSFAIADGIAPSNEGRGYVLRRILRRAVRYGRSLGLHELFFHKLSDAVVAEFGSVFPELRERQPRINSVLKAEEESFNRTLDRGLELFEEVVAGLTGKTFPAAEAFKLYDTYGFPLDLTELMARERGLTVEVPGFEKLMDQQRRRARQDYERKKTVVTVVGEGLQSERTKFLGYDNLEAEAVVETVVPGEKPDTFEIVLDQTPFYAEMGGQVGDTGIITLPAPDDREAGRLEVLDTQAQGEVIVHKCRLAPAQAGTPVLPEVWRAPEVGEAVRAAVDRARRANVQRHHTGTHLFHWALREVAGKDARQRGSLVAPDRFRFDFNLPERLAEQQIADIERLVNERIRANLPVYWYEAPYAEIRDNPRIIQFFGEKYGKIVRIVQVGGHVDALDGFSMELCGGCHVRNTGDIGLFKIVKESAVAAGVRRVEAVCGEFAREFIQRQKTNQAAESERERAREQEKEQERRTKAEAQKRAGEIAVELLGRARSPSAPLVAEIPDADADLLRAVVDALKPKFASGVAVLGGVADGKVHLICYVTPDLVKAGKHAGKIVGAVAKICGGGGGGRPDLAMAGGKLPEKLPEALASVPGLLMANERN